MKPFQRIIALLLLTLTGLAGPLMAQESTDEIPLVKVALEELAAQADLVALVRVLDTDYEYTRQFPSGGTAFLQVLIPYKVSRPLEDILEVYDEGLHPGECYFENPTVLEEGRRHLVFLKFSKDVKEQYNGLAPGCRLEVLVADDGQYALRYPPNGIGLSDELGPLARPITFADEYAWLEDEEITPAERVALLESGFLEKVETRYRYTHGIALSEVRKLMGPDALTLDRSLK